jgi:hypothetical protein
MGFNIKIKTWPSEDKNEPPSFLNERVQLGTLLDFLYVSGTKIVRSVVRHIIYLTFFERKPKKLDVRPLDGKVTHRSPPDCAPKSSANFPSSGTVILDIQMTYVTLTRVRIMIPNKECKTFEIENVKTVFTKDTS